MSKASPIPPCHLLKWPEGYRRPASSASGGARHRGDDHLAPSCIDFGKRGPMRGAPSLITRTSSGLSAYDWPVYFPDVGQRGINEPPDGGD